MHPGESDAVFSPVELPCGRVLRNRFVKVALYEHLARLFGGPPNAYHCSLYAKWSQYDWGMIFTGNVQVSPDHLSLARDIVLPRELSEESVKPFRELADAMHGEREERPMAIMQLSHAGRQSPNILGGRLPFSRPLAPSSVRLGSSLKNNGLLSDLLHRIMFQVPNPMSVADINEVVDAFARGAKLAVLASYDGVELHVAHGYLLAQFISPKSNKRTDEYSCSPDNVLRLLHRIVSQIRATVPSDFVLGVKFNAADYADDLVAATESPALDHVRSIAGWGSVDFIEISGGDYEKPDFMTTSASPSARQALFADFSRHTVHVLADIPHAPLVLLTGGLASPAQLHAALAAHHTHLLGLGRAAVLRPDLPRLLKTQLADDAAAQHPFAPPPDLRLWSPWPWVLTCLPRIRLLGAGASMAWYVVMLRRLATRSPAAAGGALRADYSVGALGGILWMWAWFGPEFAGNSMKGHALAALLSVLFVGACVFCAHVNYHV
ncbi:hypothetical protein B0H10DRAFT_1801780 [Mycena sp. CBHHK59/15]|nr:hypothetical protein B0H10DRAFT_1801780 [Mycena sp. CBHHK59/15]